MLLLTGLAVLLAGCASPPINDRLSASVSPDFPPAPPTRENTPNWSYLQGN